MTGLWQSEPITGHRLRYEMSSQLLRMFAFVLVLCVTLESATVGAATINEPPGDSEIEQVIAEELPGYWGLHSNSLTGPVDYGNAIEPDWRWRFETVITPKEPLFMQGGKRDNVGPVAADAPSRVPRNTLWHRPGDVPRWKLEHRNQA